MKLKALALTATTLALAACGKTLLWKSSITDAAFTGAPLALVTDSTNATYQLYPVGTTLQLRKLDSAGKPLWNVAVDDTLADTTGASTLKATSTGVVVGYGTGTTAAYVKAFDANGVALWSSDLGTHTAESIADLVVGSDDSVSLTLKIAAGKTNTLRLSAVGGIVWDKVMPNCSLNLFCAPSLAISADGLLVQTNAELSSTKTYLIDSAGTTLWTKSRSTGISLSGVAANPITFTTGGFVVTHAFATWQYDMSGNQSWSVAYGGTTPVVSDASGNLFVANGSKVTKLDSTGAQLSEIVLPDQLAISQIEWKETLKRLVVLSQYSSKSSIIIGKITMNVGSSLWYFDQTGKQMAKYNGVPTVSTGDACDPFPSCTTVETTYGDTWTRFATTGNRMTVMSGMVVNSDRYAVSYNIN